MNTTEKLAECLRDLLRKIRRDAPDLSGKLMGDCDAALREFDAERQQAAGAVQPQDEREAFEAAYTLKLLTMKDAQRAFRRLSHTPDEYEVASVHAAWVMWQYARAALPQPAPEAQQAGARGEAVAWEMRSPHGLVTPIRQLSAEAKADGESRGWEFRPLGYILATQPVAGGVPDDPMDWPLPCDVVVGGGTHRKGTTLRSLVGRMRMLHREAFGDPPSPEEQAANLARLQGKVQA